MSRKTSSSADPADMPPEPELPLGSGPQNEEEQEIYDLIQESLENGTEKEYASVAEFIAELQETVRKRLK